MQFAVLFILPYDYRKNISYLRLSPGFAIAIEPDILDNGVLGSAKIEPVCLKFALAVAQFLR
jgi:hypothetical protein